MAGPAPSPWPALPGAREALRQIQQSARALLEQGKVDETWEFFLAALEAVLVKNRELELLIAKLRREGRGTRSERLDPAQLSLLLEALLDQAGPEAAIDPEAEARMIARVDEARSNGDTVGGVFEVVAHGVPIGLGSYVHWDRRLDAALAAAVMSINIVKGVEFGLGFEQTRRFGSQVHDVIEGRTEFGDWIHRSNNAGGLTGGVSNGQPIVVRGAVKPISTLARPLPSADLITGEPVEKAHYERSDISVVPAAGVVGEAMVMLTLVGFVLEKFGGDSLAETRDNLARYRERVARAPEAPVPGGRRVGEAPTPAPAGSLTGTDVAGSGGDD